MFPFKGLFADRDIVRFQMNVFYYRKLQIGVFDKI